MLPVTWQVLNIAIFRAIGHEGVYYGEVTEYGHLSSQAASAETMSSSPLPGFITSTAEVVCPVHKGEELEYS